MLQAVNIPSGPLPEVPSAPPDASGDAGERAEFAQLLQQANAVEGVGAHDEPAAPPEKDTARDRRTDARTRASHDHKPHDVRRARAASEPADARNEALDEAACLRRRREPTEASAISIESVAPQTPESTDDPTAAPTPDGLALPASMHGTEPPPAARAVASAVTAPAPSAERDTGVRFSARIGTREQRLPTRGDINAAAPPDSGTAQPTSSPDIALPQSKDAASDLALRGAAAGRATGAPLFERTPAESTAPFAQATAFAREISHPISTHGDAVAEAALQAAPDEAAFAPALGAQLALWVKDGVQEARLQLHPAELGPIGVQIAIEGRAAHVDFTVAVAATRDSIEQSLPALAAALRESGFTLAGGGVFGGRSGSHDSGGGRATPSRGDGARGAAAIGSEGAADPAAPQARRWARSLVDVYA